VSTTKAPDIDRIVHEPARLVILTILSAVADAEFKYLQNATGLSKGNLSSHLSKLEGACYIEQTKSFRGKVPVTTVAITKQGLKSLKQYRTRMTALLRADQAPAPS
jgi:DNA-binding MarR family transcriptional regulator